MKKINTTMPPPPNHHHNHNDYDIARIITDDKSHTDRNNGSAINDKKI